MMDSRTVSLVSKPLCEGRALIIDTADGAEGIRDVARWLIPHPNGCLPLDRHALILDRGRRIGTHVGSLETRELLWVGEIVEMGDEQVTLTTERRLFETEVTP